jgi:hypothetical protein
MTMSKYVVSAHAKLAIASIIGTGLLTFGCVDDTDDTPPKPNTTTETQNTTADVAAYCAKKDECGVIDETYTQCQVRLNGWLSVASSADKAEVLDDMRMCKVLDCDDFLSNLKCY